MLIGGSLDPTEALATLSGYGLLPADLDLDAAMTDTDCMSMMGTFLAAVEMPFEAPETTGEPMTRADLAALLMTLFNEE